MIWLVTRLRRDMALWDRPTRIAVALGAVLLIAALILLIAAPSEMRRIILVGVVALLIVIEISVLWGNRSMVSAFTRGQRLYLEGDFTAVRDLLESVHAKADARALTLLGNTYRQLGQLSESESVLSEAVDKAPNHYFPLYGFGRTLLSEGRYAEAVVAIRSALDLNAPPVVRADLGEAYYRLRLPDEALAALQAAPTDEPHRALMVGFLLYQLGAAEPPAPEVVRAGLPYWEAAAERFRHTPYGLALSRDVRAMLNQGT